jgi:hypothetical protein
MAHTVQLLILCSSWHMSGEYVNPLNAELNLICHLLIFLGDLTFVDKCIVSISNKMQRHTVYLYLETALQLNNMP